MQSARKELESKQGAEFDRCYVSMVACSNMKAQDVMTVFQRHASSPLKAVLSEGQKTVSTNLQQSKDMCKKMEAKMIASRESGTK